MKTFDTQEFKTLTSQGLTIVDFYAQWCEPCKLLTPIFNSIQEEIGSGADFIKVDIDNNLELARKYNISSVPTVLIIKDGTVVDSTVGFVPKEMLKNKINNHL